MRTASSKAVDRMLGIELNPMVCEVRREGYTLPNGGK
jgi:hypothetical protein